ncbi:uncharacterized protein MELLADRAFT_69668 [Melampsora larici-populina 98AG31]|uniref:Uncharacterized protein n=1 Tax=Melampsora larici-populina (strain 98AG31 / pathotype 3-4-7) TaxID=747676 RepID=F4SBP3_MELLP|nr:uncharacterized protein MELLADRAFT_69668 [Melampsora larici-populina 98AG31]EGF97933.1 hypothetical protein MELLADRAFT_69668 [Melampsora larici-populina 98AG31]
MLAHLSLSKCLGVAVLKALFYHTSSGLEFSADILGGTNGMADLASWSDYEPFKESKPTGLFDHKLRNEARLEGEQLNQVFDHRYTCLGNDDHGPSKRDILSTHPTYCENLTRDRTELAYDDPSSLDVHLQHLDDLQNPFSGNIWEDTHWWSTPHMLSSTQTVDIFDSSVYINEYFDYLNEIHTYEDLEKNNHPGKNTCGLQQLSNPILESIMTIEGKSQFSYNQYPHTIPSQIVGQDMPGPKTICGQEEKQGKDIIETFTDVGDGTPVQINPISHRVTQEMQLGNKLLEFRQVKAQFQKNSVMEPEIHSPTISKSEKKQEKSVQMVGRTNHNTMLEGLSHLSVKTEDSVSEGKALKKELLAKKRGRGSHLSRNLIPTSICIDTSKKQKLSSIEQSCLSKTRTKHGLADYAVDLQSIGMNSVNRSSNLCYEIYNFFSDIYKQITAQTKFIPEEVEDIKRAVRNAGQVVVMTFLGILKVFEGKGCGSDEIDDLLNNGWNFIKEFYGSWKSSGYEKFGFGQAEKYVLNSAFDPDFHLRYLKLMRYAKRMPLSLAHSISLLWSKQREKSKIPQDLSKSLQKIRDASNNESQRIQGGLYDRNGIRNHSFWGPAQFLRRNLESLGDTMNSSHLVWKLASNAAQFHTPAGRNICKEMHDFFEDLIEKLQLSYNDHNGHHTSQHTSAESDVFSSATHSKNLSLIVKAVSIAEYRLTVPFIGLLRILHLNNVTVGQLHRLMNNVVNFLKDEFSKWEDLDFCPRNINKLFEYKRCTSNSQNLLGETNKMFQNLFGYSDRNGFPSQAILFLLSSWHTSVIRSNPASKNYLDFQVEEIPPWDFMDWTSYVKDILLDQDSIDGQKWMSFMNQG